MAQLHHRRRKVQVRPLYRIIGKLVEAVSNWMNISCRTWSGGLMLVLVHVGVKELSHWHWHHRLFFQHICLVLLSCTTTLPILADTSSHTSSASSRTLDSKFWKIRLVLLHQKCIHTTIVTENVCPVHADWFKFFYFSPWHLFGRMASSLKLLCILYDKKSGQMVSIYFFVWSLQTWDAQLEIWTLVVTTYTNFRPKGHKSHSTRGQMRHKQSTLMTVYLTITAQSSRIGSLG